MCSTMLSYNLITLVLDEQNLFNASLSHHYYYFVLLINILTLFSYIPSSFILLLFDLIMFLTTTFTTMLLCYHIHQEFVHPMHSIDNG